MSATSLLPGSPIEARFMFTEDISRASMTAIVESARPQMVRLFVLPLLLLEGYALAHDEGPTFMFGLVAIIGGLFVLYWWDIRRRIKKQQVEILGKMITVRFFDEEFELSQAQASRRIRYSDVESAGRNNRGLVIFMGRLGSTFIPTEAFEFPALRDLVFSHLGRVLKKK